MAATVPATTQKSNRAYYAHVYDQAGTLVQGADGRIYFLTDDDLVVFEVAMAPFACVLGEVGLSDTQAIMDQIHGGAAAVCTSRQMEVA